jgi:hypothetical protein
VRTTRHNVQAESKEKEAIIFVDQFQTMQARGREMAQARRRNLVLQHQEEIEEEVMKILGCSLARKDSSI